MDRQPHDYANAMAFAQQQQQQQQQQMFGFQPHPQQFPPPGPPFMAPHPSLQQFPFPRNIPPHQINPHHLMHLQQQQHQPPPHGAFPPHHLPPHMAPPPHFHQPFDSMPPPAPSLPPADPELQKRIDKLVEYAAKNGPEFEAMICDKQRDNPAYAFLFGAEGHSYYRYKLWLATRPADGPFGSVMAPPINPMMNPSALSPVHLSSGATPQHSMMGGPQLHQGYPPTFDQHQIPPHSQPFLGQPRGEYEPPTKSFKGLAGPLPSDVAAELHSVLNNLTGTKESIKSAKMWFMQRSPFAPALAEALKERVFMTDDPEKQLHIVFLANDILFDSLLRRINPSDLDNEALAFKPVLGQMLARIYHNPHNKDANQSRLEKIVQFWASKEVYDQETIHKLESEMTGGAPLLHSCAPETARLDLLGTQQQAASHGLSQWQPDVYKNSILGPVDQELREKPPASVPASQFHLSAASVPTGIYPLAATNATLPGSSPIQASLQAAAQPLLPHLLPASTASVGDQPRPPYPLFPPGLIPGMVRKMQIGSGVPYSPLSPLDIPTVIPPSTVPQSDILDRVSKFFKEIGEVNPSQGLMKPSGSASDHDDYERDEYDREEAVRKGGACIPPPANLQVDPETGMYPDGSVERKHGSSGRLGLGAAADPNEVSQYDDLYSSYRKQRSTGYHSSMSARSTTR